jgi:hypothetical protein
MNGVVHFIIVEELTNLELFYFLGSSTSEHSNAKHKRASKSIIKLGLYTLILMVVKQATTLDVVIAGNFFKPSSRSTCVNFEIGDRQPLLITICNLQFAKFKIQTKRNLGPIWCY